MKDKKLLYLGAAFVVLLAIFLLSRMSDKTVQKTQMLLPVDTTQITQIRLVSPANGEIVFAKENEIWRIKQPLDFAADLRNVNSMLEKLAEMKIESVASTRKEGQTEYDTGDSAAVFAEFKAGDRVLGSFYMGKLAGTRRHTYFRLPKSDETLMVKGNYKYFFDRKLKDWRNKMVLELNPEGVEAFKITYPDHYFTVARRDSLWYMQEDKKEFEVSKKLVDPALNYLSRVRAGDFFDPDSGQILPDFSKPACTIEITFSGGQNETIFLVPEEKGEKRYFIKKESDPTIYYVYSSTAKSLMKDVGDFREKALDKRPGSPPIPHKMND